MRKFFGNTRLMLYSIGTGLLLWLSWPPSGFPFLIFLAMVPLFLAEERIFKNRDAFHPLSLFFYAWLAFFVWNVLTTWWIMYASFPGMVMAVVLNSFFMAIPWGLMHYSRRILPGKQGPVSLIILWMTFEFLHTRWDMSWSWLDLGNAFAAYPSWIQWYEYTGASGGTLWILIMNLLIFSLLKQILENKAATRLLVFRAALVAAFFVVPAIISFAIKSGYSESIDPVEVVVIQPNQDPYDQAKTREEVMRRIGHMIELADKKVTPSTRYVVAPEGASPRGIWQHEDENHPTVRAIRQHLEKHPQLSWVIGSFSYKMYRPADPVPNTARQYADSDRYYDAFNSAIMVSPGQPVQYYHKSMLVPGIERMPFFTILRPLGQLVESFGGISGSLGRQDHRSTFIANENEKVAAPICYESIYGDYMRDFIRDGAGLIFIITNDGWWRDTPGYRQHHQYARLRAIESRRSIARSANTGISSFIDQKGNIIKQTNWWEPDAIRATLNQNQKITYFTRNGNYLGQLSFFLTVLLILYMISRKLMRGKRLGQ